MQETNGYKFVAGLRKKWMYTSLLSLFFLASALTIIICVLLHKLFLLSLYWGIPCLGVLFLAATKINRSWNLSEWEVSGFLSSTKPSLEESVHLLLRPQDSLNLLERLQTRKVESALRNLSIPDPFKKQFTLSLIALMVASAGSLAMFYFSFHPGFTGQNTTVRKTSFVNSTAPVLTGIKKAIITITPPSYTGKAAREQNRFDLLAEEGAMVSWQIQTEGPLEKPELIFNDSTTIQLTGDENLSNWKAQKIVRMPGFYQVKIDNWISELYKIEIVKDQPPTIAIQSPGPNTSINYGGPARLMIKAALGDDYGIHAAGISATISSGRGEAVKFKEQRLFFDHFTGGGKGYQLQKLVDCSALGMQPGDELYFFVSAIDNHKQETRSEVYMLTLQDTTVLMPIDGMIGSLDITPELFRSQRQIIIETEQLIKNRSVTTAEAFRKKSNDLGIDQKLLRLRYGKFLGEESNTEIGDHGEEEGHGNEHTDNANEIIENYMHKHDNAEDAGFFDPGTKKQLKATLSEMWGAELKLRTFLPKQALPYEYKALRLLKDLQQKSRVYVQKTGFKATPLKVDKRLTGDLSGIYEPVTSQNFQKPETAPTIIRRTLGILEQLKTDGKLSVSSKVILQQAFGQLIFEAADQPAVYLTSLSSLKKILNDTYTIKDIDNAEKGLQKMTAGAAMLPYPGAGTIMNLSKQYFINLNKGSSQ